jgi:predicted TIM-barrel enzyme|tara:strand:- start:366 stop:677 length:312 start_codon:yes stop_codon:yes gene_type:complete
MSRFYDLFQRKPVLGMLHLSGKHPVIQALDDLRIYEEGEVDGVIVENYHGTEEDVRHTLEAISRRTTPLKVGVNVLGSLELLLNSQRDLKLILSKSILSNLLA